MYGDLNRASSQTVSFGEASLGEWRTTGQHSQPSDARRHSVGWPWCVPGLYPDTKPLAAGDQTARDAGLVIGKDGSNEQIRFAAGEIKAGANATDFVALATLVANELTAIKNWANNHTHSGVTAGAGTSGAPSPATQLSNPGSVAATLFKAK
jgi:hypothetical protein